MKYLPLLMAGVWRKPMRTTLTFLSITIAFLLFGLLYGLTAGLERVVLGMNANTLIVWSDSRMHPLPVAYAGQIARVPNVQTVYSVTNFAAFFREPGTSIAAFALGGDIDWNVMTEYRTPPEQLAAFERTRTGAVVGRKLAEQNGWKIGDRVTLQAYRLMQRDGSRAWPFDIVGIYDRTDDPELANEFWLNYEYLDQGRVQGRGTVDRFHLRTASIESNARVAAEIDALFANSPYSTNTQSAREYLRSTIDQTADIGLMVTAVVGASFFTLLLLTATSMMESLRQRVPELAVMKAVGFSDSSVLALVILEGLVVCMVGAIAGLALATIVFPVLAAPAGLRGISMPLQVLIAGLFVAAVVGMVSSAVPALRAKRLSIVEALARRH